MKSYEEFYKAVEARADSANKGCDVCGSQVKHVIDGEGTQYYDPVLRAAETYALVARCRALEGALTGVWGLIESGYLVRDISRDADPRWVLAQLDAVKKLKAARTVLAAVPPTEGA